MNALTQADGVGYDAVERPSMHVDIACVGFGPAMGGFLTTVAQGWSDNPDAATFQSKASEGMPLQVLCYERADDLAAGVSGVVTRARAVRGTLPDLKPEEIPMACDVKDEHVFYLLDPVGASRRSWALRCADALLRAGSKLLRIENDAFELPWTPAFLHKHGGLVLSIGQFNQWVASKLMSTGLVQIWPGTPASGPLFAGQSVSGVRLADQGVDAYGDAEDGFRPGMGVHARLAVGGAGPVGGG